MLKTILALSSLAITTVALGTPSDEKDAVELFRVIPGNVATAFREAHVMQAQRIQPNKDSMLKRPGIIRFQAPDGSMLRAKLKSFWRRSANSGTWRGTVEGEPESRVVITVHNDVLVGAIFGQDHTYVIEPLPDGGTAFKTVNPGAYPECGGALAPPAPRQTMPGPPDIAADSANRIDVMILYTPEARDAAGGVAGIEATAQAAVDIANDAFSNSDVTPRFNLVHTQLASYNDSGNLGSDLSWLKGNSGVAGLRDTHGADLVSLLVSAGGGYCGRGYVMRTPGLDFEDWAFQVTARNCAVGNLSWAHEHGHNMGMEHDPANGIAPGSASYPWSFGHYVSGSYRTVMSYSNQCTNYNCTRVPYFSNPNVSYLGAATGIADQRDNHRTANSVASVVANFRPQVCNASNDLLLENQTVSTTEVYEACVSITSGNGFIIDSTADVTFDAGERITLTSGFRVESGGRLTARLSSL